MKNKKDRRDRDFLNELNIIYNEECVEGIRSHISDDSIDMVLTSPPYDNMRSYKGYSFDFEGVAQELWRIIKPGGVMVWIVGDATIKGDETGTSFKQALYFKELGFKLSDTMIYYKTDIAFPRHGHKKYPAAFEYMFVFSKDKVNTFNLIKDRKNKSAGRIMSGTVRQVDGELKKSHNNGKPIPELGSRSNVWGYSTGKGKSSLDKVAFEHPAIFPEKLAKDHILSWSNPGDTVLDPFMGSGTTAKMAMLNDRNYIGFEISKEYCEIAEERLNTYKLINT